MPVNRQVCLQREQTVMNRCASTTQQTTRIAQHMGFRLWATVCIIFRVASEQMPGASHGLMLHMNLIKTCSGLCDIITLCPETPYQTLCPSTSQRTLHTRQPAYGIQACSFDIHAYDS